MRNANKLLLGLAIVAVLLLHPLSRAALFWLLPLGSGLDDLIAILAIITLAVVAAVKGVLSIPKFIEWLKN